MLAVTDRFLSALRDTHAVSVAATLYRPSDPGTPISVDVLGGTVTIDRDARVRRQGTLEVEFTLEDQLARDVVRELPFGGQATIERGILYADGTVERVQLGRFRVDSIVWSELQGQASLTLSDHFAQVQDEAFLTPWNPAGLKPSDAAVQAIQDVFGATILYHVETDPVSEPTIQGTVYEEDRAQAVGDLASSVGAEAFFDNLGDFVLRPRHRTTPVAWTIDAGERGVMIAASETIDRSSVRNGVSVRGQPGMDQAPIYALATHDDPTSPTRWGGPMGRIPLISSSTAVGSQAQADAAAQSLLNLRLGLARTVTFQAVPNPALEPDDLIRIIYADGRVEQLLVNAVQIGLGADATLSITTTSKLGVLPLLRSSRRTMSHVQAGRWRKLVGA